MTKPRKPRGLGAAGSRIWETVNDEFMLTEEPHKLELLRQAAKVADLIAQLDLEASRSSLTTRGSMGQQVISPFIAEARFQRGLLTQLLGKLGLPDTDEEADEKSAKLSRTRSAAGKQKQAHLRVAT